MKENLEVLKKGIAQLMELGNDYIKQMDVTDVSILKICLITLGAVIGLSLPKQKKSALYAVLIPIFFITYVLAMIKFLTYLKERREAL